MKVLLDRLKEAFHNPSFLGISVAIVGGYVVYRLIFSNKAREASITNEGSNKREKEDLNTLGDPKVPRQLELIEKEHLTHDVRRFRFALPSANHVLGIELGHHIKLSARINGENVARPYTPTSSIDQKGYFELVIKIYRPNTDFPNGGKMSQYLDSMEIGSKIDVSGPVGRIVYKRNGLFQYKLTLSAEKTIKTYKNVGMIAGGTGITPMFQLIKDICDHKSDDKTKISLIFCNKTENDILLQDQLDRYKKENPDQFDLWYTVSKSVKPDWGYDTGRINEEMLAKHLPAPSEDTLILICGPSGMVKGTCLPNLANLGYTTNTLFVC